MRNSLRSVLLIDDDEAITFYHKIILEQANYVEQVDVAINGKRAIEYLTAVSEGKCQRPDLIFLDINMPVMNGWEFLEAYRTLPEDIRSKIVLVILSASLNPADKIKAENYPEVSGYGSKPLTIEMLNEIISKHFE